MHNLARKQFTPVIELCHYTMLIEPLPFYGMNNVSARVYRTASCWCVRSFHKAFTHETDTASIAQKVT